MHATGLGNLQSFAYSYDATGNRTSVTSGAGEELCAGAAGDHPAARTAEAVVDGGGTSVVSKENIL